MPPILNFPPSEMFDQVTKRKEQYSNAEGLLQFIEGISRHFISQTLFLREEGC